MSTRDANSPSTGVRRAWLAGAIIALGAVVLLVHGRSLTYGLFMDDWAHYRQLRECDWSLGGLTDACRLELVGGIAELWWLPEVTLRFFRPVAFGLMKLTYSISDWSPTAAHAASLLWHLAATTLLLLLLRRLGAGRWTALGVATLFALHPGHIATVQWIACQTELMVTTLLLGATLCWGRFRRWPGFADGRDGPGHPGWFVGTAVLFVAALGCRENAIMFPFVLAAMEPLLNGRRTKRIWSAYAVFAVLLVAYLATRAYYLHGVSLPPRPYIMPPNDPGFLRFVFDKACYYLIGEFLLIPCVPIGGLPFLRARPLTFYGLSLLAVALVVVAVMLTRRRGVGLLGPAWLLGFIVPVLPAFASPHHLYLPGVGWAICVMVIVRALAGVNVDPRHAVTRTRRVLLVLGVLALAVSFGLGTFYFALTFETGYLVERNLIEEITSAPTGLHDGDTLYIANLPLLGHYLRLGVEERSGCKNLRVVPLVWSPRILGPVTPTELVRIDDRTVEVHVAGDRYFSGPLGRLVQSATGGPIPAVVDRLDDLGLRIEVLERDEAGLAALRFTFARPPLGPGLHFFWGSRARWGYEVQDW